MLDTQKHKVILIQILKDIYSDPTISSLLGFKGGTSAYLFYKLPRFSVDLDFNLLEEKEKNHVFQKIEKIITKYGQIKEKRKKRSTLFFLLSYDKKLQNVKIEISVRKYPDSYQVKNYLGISMLVMEKQDMLAHKLVALSDRKQIANRDVYDIWFFMKNKWDINKEIVELRTEKKLKQYLNDCIKLIQQINKKDILQGLGDVVPKQSDKQWIKDNLKKEAIFWLKFYQENYI